MAGAVAWWASAHYRGRMPTLPPEPPGTALYKARGMAESFGTAPQGYDRARPGYPAALVARIVAESPGVDVLDVGCGTGIAARQFRSAGCKVLGIEPDARMAEYARERGLPVEVATFEDWEPAGRTFDTVIAAQSWHWVDPVAGAARAAEVLRPGGLLAIFGHLYEPPAQVAEPFAAAFHRVVPNSPFARRPAGGVAVYQAGYARIADTIRETGRFAEPEQWRFDWEQVYTRDQWLALLPTTGGLTRLGADQLAVILAEVGTAIDELGGSFTMCYTTLATVAARLD